MHYNESSWKFTNRTEKEAIDLIYIERKTKGFVKYKSFEKCLYFVNYCNWEDDIALNVLVSEYSIIIA